MGNCDLVLSGNSDALDASTAAEGGPSAAQSRRVTIEASAFPEHFGTVVGDIGFPKVGQRGRRNENTIWRSLVMLAVRTGAANRPIEDYDMLMDGWCETYMKQHVACTPAAIRTALCALRKAVYFDIPLVDEYGRVRSKAKILRDYRELPLQRVPLKPRKRKSW